MNFNVNLSQKITVKNTDNRRIVTTERIYALNWMYENLTSHLKSLQLLSRYFKGIRIEALQTLKRKKGQFRNILWDGDLWRALKKYTKKSALQRKILRVIIP